MDSTARINEFAQRITHLLPRVDTDFVATRVASHVKTQVRNLREEMRTMLDEHLDPTIDWALRGALSYFPKLNTKPSQRWHGQLYGARIDLHHYLYGQKRD